MVSIPFMALTLIPTVRRAHKMDCKQRLYTISVSFETSVQIRDLRKSG